MAAAQAAGVSTSSEHLTPVPRQADQNGQLNPPWDTGHAELMGRDGGESEHKGELGGPCRGCVCMWCLQVGHALSSRPKGRQNIMMDIKHRKERVLFPPRKGFTVCGDIVKESGCHCLYSQPIVINIASGF